MGVLDGQAVSAAVTNPAFINKNIDDSMPNKLGLSRALSGATIADIQATANKLYAATGASESQTGTVYNATASTITNGDTYQTALTKVADKFDPATGHMHTGAAGDGPVLAVVLDIAASGYSPVDGHITFTPGPNMTIAESGGNFTFTSAGGIAVDTLAVSGNTPLTGNVTFTAGSNVSIVQSGQNFEFSASGGGGSGGAAIAFYANLPSGTITPVQSPITWTAIKDTASAYSGTTYTIPSTGYYFISMQVEVLGTYSSGQYSNAHVLVNGTPFLDMFQGDTGPGLGATSFSQSTLRYFTVGDLITTECQSIGSTPSFSTAPDSSLFSIFSVSGGVSSLTPSQVTVNTQASYGSTGLSTVVYTNLEQNIGTDITYTSDSVNGDYFTINTTGNYAVFLDAGTTINSSLGVTLNSSSTSTNILSLATSQIFMTQFLIGGQQACYSRSAAMTAGDVIRVQGDTAPLDTTSPYLRCSITRVS